jgi:hypothetical protein
MFDSLFAQSALLFTIPALVGTVVFLLKLGLMTIGGTDIDFDTDVDLDLGDVDTDSTDAFTLLSIQSIAAFLMGFGWGGLCGLLGLDWPLSWSLLLGLGVGVGIVWLLMLMLKGIYDLQNSGNIDIRQTIGSEGTVYVNVPARDAGRGRVRVIVSKRARIYDAVSEGDEIQSSTRVKVTGVNDDNSLNVRPV